jgi:2-haloacid dehalogenase
MPADRATIPVFDIGNVLLDWDPRHLYRKIFADPAKMEWFLAEVCTLDWNLEQDRGRPFADAVAEATARHPDYAAEIRAYDTRWLEMVNGTLAGSVALLERLRRNGIPTYAITNFSAEKFNDAVAAYPFLGGFDGIIVSADERLLKPDAAIYRLLLDRHGLAADACLFIDDKLANVAAAEAVGMQGHHFVSVAGLAVELRRHGFPV